MPVGNYHSSIFCERQSTRKLEFSISVTFTAKSSVELPIGLEDLNPVVLKITHNDESLGIYCDSPGTVELTAFATFPAKNKLELAVTIKLDNTVVFCVGYQATVVLGDSHVVWTVQLSVVAAMGTKGHDVCTVHLEELDSVVVFISDQQVAIFGQS